ncbi:hypothetical protein E1286_24145 [Nonomuraea terrae]|uniref:C-type cytochrome biogenesis protein CcmI n=1 Tax=Nonomuraea terrae TaxID=2530383 RepID=A0A4R4YPG2_9ACTN|nr:hypothetical protein [Nonomuraea terrae]TDD45412.1 hypothetical protein E1286_24145 [Nonomuraea terrae]
MTGLVWCLLTTAAALAAVAAAKLIRPHLAACRAERDRAARAHLARLRAEGELALDPEAAFLRTLAGHPELHDLTSKDRT